MPLRSLAADDIFISYTRLDASTYAAGLADELTRKGFSCFIDKLGTDPDADLPGSLKRKIRSCAMLVVVCTERAGTRQTIEDEIGEFLRTGRRSSIVLVDFGEAVYKARWYKLVEGIAPEPEKNSRALDDGNPSPSVISRIEKQFKYTRRNERLRRVTLATAAVLALLVLASAVAGVFAAQQLSAAKAASAAASAARAEAAGEKSKAEAARREAGDAQAEADKAKADATEQKRLADLATQDAKEKAQLADAAAQKAQAAETRAAAEQARAEQQGAIADSRSLANRSQTVLRQRPNELSRSVTLAADALKRSHTVEADAALRDSLSLLPRYIGGSSYAGDIVATALSPDARHFAALLSNKLSNGLSNKTLRLYRVGDAAPLKEIPLESGQVNDASGVALSNDAAYAAVSSEKSVTIYDLKNGGSHTIEIKGESITVGKVALSPGGKYLALILEDGELEGGINRASLRDAESGQELPGFSETENVTYNDVAFSAKGNLAFGARAFGPLGNPAGKVFIWTLSDKLQGDESANKLGEEDFARHETINQDNEVNAVAPGVDDSYFATDRGVWKRVPLGEFKPVAFIPVKDDDEAYNLSYPVHNLAFNADGKMLTIVRGMPLPAGAASERSGTDKEVEVWDATQHPDAAHAFQSEAIQSVGFLPGNRLFAAAPALNGKGNLHVLNAVDCAEPNPDADRATEDEWKFISPDARFVIMVSGKTAHVRDVWRSSVADVDFGSDLKGVDASTLSAGGEFLALAGEAANGGGALALVYARDGDSYRETGRLRLGEYSPQTTASDGTPAPLAVTPDGRRLVTLAVGSARVWDVTTGREVTPAALRALSGIGLIQLSNGGRYLAAVYNDASENNSTIVLVLRLADGGVADRVSFGTSVYGPLLVVFSPHEHYLLTSGNGPTHLVKLDSGGVKRLRDDSTVRAAVFSADERYFATGSSEGVLKVFVTGETQSEITRLQDTGEVTAIAFSGDDRLLATASRHHNPYDLDYEENFPLRVWMLRPGDLIAEANGRLAAVPSYLREGADALGAPGARGEPSSPRRAKPAPSAP